MFPRFVMWFLALAHSSPPLQLPISLGPCYTLTFSSYIFRTKGGNSFPLLLMSGYFNSLLILFSLPTLWKSLELPDLTFFLLRQTDVK